MKRLSAATYAQLLFDSTLNVTGERRREIMQRWLQLVRRHRAMKLLPRIVAHLERIGDEAAKQTRVHVTAATVEETKQLTAELTDVLGRVVIDLTVDPSLRGGLVLRVGDDEIDGSLKTRFRQLHHHLINA